MLRAQKYTQALWANRVESLFAQIYPGWGHQQCSRMAYPESLPLHILTILAVREDEVIGQLNVFRVGQDMELTNIGYHVHPAWHRRGVASYLLCQAWSEVSNVYSDGMVIQAERANIASCRLAEHAGFSVAEDSLIERYRMHLHVLQKEGGLIYHHERTDLPPNKAIQRTALRAATDL
jgi:RimJ/RimL family protein N-acetyltransferase